MKRVKNGLVGFLLGLCAASGLHAQLTLERSVSAKLADHYIADMPRDEVDAYVAGHGVSYAYGDHFVDKPEAGDPTFGQTSFAWRFRNDDVYYTHVFLFRSNAEASPLCKENVPVDQKLDSSSCEGAILNFRQCHLFVMDVNRKVQAVLPIDIPQPDFIEAKPGCFDVHAMAPAQVVKDGLLMVVGYYDSRWICQQPGPQCASGRKESYPDPYYKTTVLVRFDKDANGKLLLSQDKKCLLPLNKYDTIAGARNALKKGGCT